MSKIKTVSFVWKNEKPLLARTAFFIATALVSIYMVGLMVYDFGYALGVDSISLTNPAERLPMWDHLWWILKAFGWGFLANVVIRLNHFFDYQDKDAPANHS